MLNEQEVLDLLHRAVERAGTQRAFARQHKMSVAYVNDVLHKRRPLADRILAAIGCERVERRIVEYRLRKEEQD
jgi:DNA-binding transcriptional regulator YdaS (Cro superfamily)